MSVDVIAGHDGQVQAHGQGQGVGHLVEVLVLPEELESNPELAPAFAEPSALGHEGFNLALTGDPQRQAFIHAPAEVLQAGLVGALGRASAQLGDQRGELAVGAAVGRQQNQVNAFLEAELRAHDELDAELLCRHVGLDEARVGALVGQRERAVAELCGPLDELLRVGGAAQKAVVADAVQLREVAVVRLVRRSSHAGTSCSRHRRRPSIPPPGGPGRRSNPG